MLAAASLAARKGRRVEGDPARDKGDQGLGVNLDAGGAHRDIDAAGIPEPGAGVDVPVVRRVDEDLDVDLRAVLRQVVGQDLAGLEAAVVDGSADAQRAELGGLEREGLALATGDDRRLRESHEGVLGPGRLTRLEADVVAREQRAETGDAAQRDPGLDDPELRVLDHEASRALGHLGGDLHLGIVGGQPHRRHLADVHVLVLDDRLARLDTLARAGGRS